VSESDIWGPSIFGSCHVRVYWNQNLFFSSYSDSG